MPETITITELHRHTATYVKRAEAGEEFIVTVRGVAKALLIPIPQDCQANPEPKEAAIERFIAHDHPKIPGVGRLA